MQCWQKQKITLDKLKLWFQSIENVDFGKRSWNSSFLIQLPIKSPTRIWYIGKSHLILSQSIITFFEEAFIVYIRNKVWFLVSLFNGISTLFRLFNAKAILLEEQYWFYLTHSWEDKGVHTFPKGICPKVNVIARLEYEIACYDSAVHRFNHYTTRTHSIFVISKVDWAL